MKALESKTLKVFKFLFLSGRLGLQNMFFWLLLVTIIPLSILYMPTKGHGRIEEDPLKLFFLIWGVAMMVISFLWNCWYAFIYKPKFPSSSQYHQ